MPIGLALGLAISSPSFAQQAPRWLPTGEIFGSVSYDAYALAEWDPDGAGPQPSVLVIGGEFDYAGPLFGECLVTYDPATTEWQSLDVPVLQFISDIAVGPGGVLYVCGAGPQVIGRVLQLQNGVWSTVGEADNWISSIEVQPNGDLVAGGRFQSIDGVASPLVARFDGTSWFSPGTGLPSAYGYAYVADTAVTAAGDLVVVGTFSGVPGFPASGVWRCNGGTWVNIGALPPSQPEWLQCVTLLGNGDLVVGGRFTSISGVAAAGCARWNGSTWTPEGPGAIQVMDVVELPGGELVVAMDQPMDVARGSTSTGWQGLGGVLEVRQMCRTSGGDLFAAGDPVRRLAGSHWGPMNPFFHRVEGPIAVSPAGRTVVAGSYEPMNGNLVPLLCERDGPGWREIGGGIEGTVHSLAGRADTDLFVAGYVSEVGGMPVNGIARWDGTTWSSLGAGLNGVAEALAIADNGDLYATGWIATAGAVAANGIARWDGASWHALGSGLSGPGYAITPCVDGDIVVGGQFSHAGGTPAANIARWNGTSWSALGSGIGSNVYTVVELPDGSIVAGTINGDVRRWVGGTWTTLGQGTNGPSGSRSIESLLVLPGGDLLVGGQFTMMNGLPSTGIARWSGGAWTTFQALDGPVLGMAMEADGDVALVGRFSMVEGKPSLFMTRLRAGNPAHVRNSGSGCTGAGGVVQLATHDLPWQGEVFDVHASGLAPQSIGVALLGDVVAPVPLSAVLLQSLPGCELHVPAPQLLPFATGSGGIDLALPIPSTLPLLGMRFGLQVVVAELLPGGTIAAFTSSNTLAGRIGAF